MSQAGEDRSWRGRALPLSFSLAVGADLEYGRLRLRRVRCPRRTVER